jgi:hypothetical protein
MIYPRRFLTGARAVGSRESGVLADLFDPSENKNRCFENEEFSFGNR